MKINFTKYMKVLKAETKNYPIAAVFSLVMWFFAAIGVWCNYFSFESETVLQNIYQSGLVACGFVILSSVVIAIWRHMSRIGKSVVQLKGARKLLIAHIPEILSVVLGFGIYFIWYNQSDNHYINIAYVGLIIMLVVAFFLVVLNNENKQKIVLQVIISIFFASVSAFVFFLGILVCLLAVDNLIFSIPDFDNYVYSSFLFSVIVLGINIFLATLKLDSNEITIPKFLQYLLLYVLFPLYILLMAVLYVYFVKIIALKNLPNGQLNYFVLTASIFFVFFRFTLGLWKNNFKPIKFFFTYGHLFLIPCLIFQVLAVSERVNAYGLTISRWIGILFIVVMACYIILLFVKQAKYEKSILLVIGAITFISTFTPLQVEDIPVRNQIARINTYLDEYGYFNAAIDSQGNPTKTFSVLSDEKAEMLPFEVRKSISSSYQLVKESSLLPDYLRLSKSELEEDNNFIMQKVFGFKYINSYATEPSEEIEEYRSKNLKTEIPVAGYASCVAFRAHQSTIDVEGLLPKIPIINISVKSNDDSTIQYDIGSLVLSHEAEDTLYVLDDLTAVYLTNVSYGYAIEAKVFKRYSIDGFVLRK